MNSYNDLYAKIEKLINNKSISSYQINKNTGISYGNINAMRRGQRSIDNLTLKNSVLASNWSQLGT
ncbi:hypothetical protein PQ751_01675 [Staphylococcus coagulans]|nr:hypothetical protein [Staphylococcus coagulans]MDU9267847.1 hypothetical protein [Staphylococcus coagulans]MDU9279745.1 hypothetical protein [Staphylococcus coagulans]MDU9291789.1 hypothetical protein [Staphylococcus coagulans]MDU9304111.1 hypothetical protein [Staphylococcus coagulans]MDU9321170.1 hypothetical protein [Staphylococcus coagulans]